MWENIMKILHICPRYYPEIGGVEWHVKNIAERLAMKYEVSVWTTDPSGMLLREETINGVRVKRFKSWAPNEAYYFSRELKKFLIDNIDNFDIVHAHNYHAFPSLYAAQAKKENKLIFTSRYHGKGHTFFRNLYNKLYKVIAKKIFEKANKIICLSEFEKNLILSQFKLNEEKIVVIPNGINKREFSEVKGDKDNLVHRILCVSRLEKYKGIQYVIKALDKLDDNFLLDVIGKGPYKKDLLKLTSKLGLQDRVRFHQDLPRDKLLKFYFNAHVFILLSKHEAFGNVVAEALASRVPCIVANNSALSEWIDNKNCFGINYPINIDHLANLILKVIGRKANITQLLDWDEVAEKVEEVYHEVYMHSV
jgi:glycosyltransferase involved in cell wall biosynthesis